MIATKSAAPIIDQTIGKGLPPILTAKSSGKPIAPASQLPNSAPMKPKAIETRQPPRLYPAIACPTAPQRPATNNKINNDSIDSLYSPVHLLTGNYLQKLVVVNLLNLFHQRTNHYLSGHIARKVSGLCIGK